MAEYKDLWDCVNKVKMDIEVASDTHNLTFYGYASDELRELVLGGLNDALVFKTKKLKVVDGVAILPPDYSAWLKVGIECSSAAGHSRLLWFSYNSDIVNIPNCSNEQFNNCCNDFTAGVNSQYWSDFWMFSSYVHNNQIVAGIYGANANINYGDFNVDLLNNEIVLGECSRHHKYIILQYRANGLGEGTNGVVLDDIFEAVVNGSHHRRVRFKSEKDLTLRPIVQQYRREKVVSWNRVMARKSSFTKETFLEVYRSSITGVAKR